MIIKKTTEQIEQMAVAGAIQARCLRMLRSKCHPGVTTAELDDAAERFIAAQGAEPSFKGYRGLPGRGPALESGMVLAIEPMVNAGGPEVRVGEDNWAVYSADGSLAAHFEFTVAVTDDGPRILTPWHEE